MKVSIYRTVILMGVIMVFTVGACVFLMFMAFIVFGGAYEYTVGE